MVSLSELTDELPSLPALPSMPSLPTLHEVAELASRLDPRPSTRLRRRPSTVQMLAIVLSLGALAAVAGVIAARRRCRPGPPAASEPAQRRADRASVAV